VTQLMDVDTVAEFAGAVRRQLSDLGPDTLDELTDGLEADLAEKLADGDSLGDPAVYAAELRAAAGFDAKRSRSAHVARGLRARFDGFVPRLRTVLAHPFVVPVVGFLLAIRPLWWAARAWALFYVLAGFKEIPSNPWDWPVLIGLFILSVQWGRGKWMPWRWSRGAVAAISVIAVLALPTLNDRLIGRLTFADTMNPDDYVSDGLLLNKQQVINIFAYGPDGKPLDGVRLYDQNGHPLEVVDDDWGSGTLYDPELDDKVLVPSDQVAGSTGWNVYPLQSVPGDEVGETGEVDPWTERSDVTPPFASVQELLE
jgi:hypothetical protein